MRQETQQVLLDSLQGIHRYFPDGTPAVGARADIVHPVTGKPVPRALLIRINVGDLEWDMTAEEAEVIRPGEEYITIEGGAEEVLQALLG